MKKLMFLAAAAACGAAFAVESANIVGYNTGTLAAGKYNLVSIPFAGVTGGTQKLTEAMSGTWLGGETYEEGDNIRVWSPAGQSYTIYYYYTDDSHQWDGWYDMGGSYYFEDVPGNENGIAAGDVFWYQSKDTKGTNHTIKFYNPTK